MVSQESMDHVTRSTLLPLLLLANFGVFQYLVLLFRTRWCDPYVLLLLATAALGWISLVPFATADKDHLQAMNDVSEGSLALLLLVQTTLVGSPTPSISSIPTPTSPAGPRVVAADLSQVGETAATVKNLGRKMKTNGSGAKNTKELTKGLTGRLVRGVEILADLLIIWDGALLVLGVVVIFHQFDPEHTHVIEILNLCTENITLAFTFVFRFALLARSNGYGWRRLLREEWLEIVCHLLFATHEYPFMLLENITGVSWEYVQALYMRITLAPCIWMTIGDHHYRLHLPHHRKFSAENDEVNITEGQEAVARAKHSPGAVVHAADVEVRSPEEETEVDIEKREMQAKTTEQ